MSNLIASLWRAQNFAYLAYHISWFLFDLYPCEELELGSSPCQALVHRKRFYFEILVAFFMFEVLSVVLLSRDLSFPHLVLTSLVVL